jgi:hypothetical protein
VAAEDLLTLLEAVIGAVHGPPRALQAERLLFMLYAASCAAAISAAATTADASVSARMGNPFLRRLARCKRNVPRIVPHATP